METVTVVFLLYTSFATEVATTFVQLQKIDDALLNSRFLRQYSRKLISTFIINRLVEFPTLQNLNENLKLIKSQNCLVEATNFGNIDLVNFEHPAILRNPILGILWELQLINGVISEPYPELVWFASEIRLWQTNFTRNTNWNICKRSRFFIDFNGLDIYFNDFVFKSKPWNCEVHLRLFKNIRLEKLQPPVSDFFAERGNNLFLKNVYPMTVLVNYDSQWKNVTQPFIHRWKVNNGAFSTVMENNEYLGQHAFISMTVRKKPIRTQLWGTFATITQIHIIRFETSSLFKTSFNQATWSQVTFPKITDISFGNSATHLDWGNPMPFNLFSK